MFFDSLQDDMVTDFSESDVFEGWIPPNCITDVIIFVSTEDMEKHMKDIHKLPGDVSAPALRTDIFSRIVGWPFSYKKIYSVKNLT